MKTSNKILLVYGAVFAVFTFGSLGLNVCRYRAARAAIDECLEMLAAGCGASVLVVEPGTTVAFHPNGYGSFTAFSRDGEMVRACIVGDTLFVDGARSLYGPNSVRRIVRGGETIDVPPVDEWKGRELAF